MKRAIFCFAALIILLSCGREEDSEEYFISILTRLDQAQKHGDLDTWKSLIHPYEWSKKEINYYLRAEELTSENSRRSPDLEGLAEMACPDHAEVRLEKSGPWARLYCDAGEFVVMTLFYRQNEKWLFVHLVRDHTRKMINDGGESKPDPDWEPSRNLRWPPDPDVFWLRPVQLIIQSDKSIYQADDEPKISFIIKNADKTSIPADQLKTFFQEIFYLINGISFHVRAIQWSDSVPDELKPGEAFVVVKDVPLHQIKPGENEIQWGVEKYISDKLTFKIQ